MSVISNKPFVKRLPIRLNFQKEITTYDVDNLYPQRVEEIMFRSPITESSIETIADFVMGDGFSENGDLVINDDGMLANDLLRQITLDVAKFRASFAVHINWNLLGEIVTLEHLEFKYVRYGLPDEMGKHKDVKVNLNWENAPGVFPTGVKQWIWQFPLYDPTFENNGVLDEDFKGQVLYVLPKKDVYPRATFDSVLDSSQTDGEVQVFELGNIQNGFLSATFVKHPGEFESEDAKNDFIRDLRSMKGAGNANSMQLIEMKNMEEFPDLLEQFPANNNDKLFELTNRNVTNRIIQGMAVPRTLLSIFPDSGMFNKEDFENSYKWMNIRTKNLRRVVERIFNEKIGPFWHEGPIDFGTIIERQFDGGAKVNNEG